MISVIVPAFNEEDYIGYCLESLDAQDFPRDQYEVIVVDNGSTDNTKKIAQEYSVKIIDHPVGNIGSVRNAGLNASCGDVIAFIDSDCVAGPDWLRNGFSLIMADKELGGLQGPCLSPKNGNLYQILWAPSESSVSKKRINRLATGSCFFRSSIFEEVGVFNERIKSGEDTDLSKRIIERGYKLILDSGCAVVHLGFPNSFSEFILRQFFQGQSYLYAFSSLGGSTFYAVLLFLVLLVFLVVDIVIFSASSSSIFLLGIFLILFAYSFYRGFVKRSDIPIYYLPACVYINFLYFFGRAMGLLSGFWLLVVVFLRGAADGRK